MILTIVQPETNGDYLIQSVDQQGIVSRNAESKIHAIFPRIYHLLWS